MRSSFISEIPCESLIKRMCGSQWRNLPNPEIDCAWGMAIVYAILNGVRPELDAIAFYLGVEKYNIANAHRRLSLNGAFLRNKILRDKNTLESDDVLAWGYYGGMAGGMAGPVAC